MKAFLDWLAALFRTAPAKPVETPPPSEPRRGDPAWLAEARKHIGTAEVAGAQHNPVVLGYFAKAGFPGIDNDETAWCAAFANAMLEQTGYTGSKSLAARSFLTWGKPVAKPYPGCVVVFWRGSPRSWEGHVGFYVSERGDKIKVLGGNQGNAVTLADYPRAQLLGYREPSTLAGSRTTRASTLGIVAAGAAGTAVLDSQTQLIGMNAVLKDLGVTMPELAVATALLQIAVFATIIWARWDDLKTKGR
ncbi:MAG: TIGR02594 family protein [Pseudomonadota bacterium]|nr:TIGR02594 family protein [Pseudomonadota bacterium]